MALMKHVTGIPREVSEEVEVMEPVEVQAIDDDGVPLADADGEPLMVVKMLPRMVSQTRTIYVSEDVPMTAEEKAAFLAEANAPAPYHVPTVVTDLQARRALLAANLLATVEAAVTAAGGETLIYWERSLVVRRDSPFIAAMVAALGLTSQQIDDLFIAASQL